MAAGLPQDLVQTFIFFNSVLYVIVYHGFSTSFSQRAIPRTVGQTRYNYFFRLPQVGLVRKYLKCKFTPEWAAAQLPTILAIFFFPCVFSIVVEMNLVAGKPVLGVYDKASFKPVSPQLEK